jgi:hypothetical protein
MRVAAGGDALDDGAEQSQPQTVGLTESGGAGQGEQRHPDEQVEGEPGHPQ